MKALKWWQKAVFYQIYPRSFADGNGDGIGDLKGMISKLDYLKDLGVDGIWLSPHYPSPQFDCGYDVADYAAVAPEYGTLAEFREFLAGCHDRGIRLILDLVLNHTSHEHAWFKESRSSRDNSKRNWYIWRDGKNGGPPNNWNSTFGGSAWEFDPQTGQYYYHFFFKEQPDINWRNPEAKQAMFNDVRFWLDMGVDGFRIDAIGTVFEHPDMPDHPVPYSLVELGKMRHHAKTPAEMRKMGNLWDQMFQYQVDRPGMHELLQELRSVIDEYDDRMLVAESDMIEYHGNGSNEMHMVFNFPLMRTERLTPAWIRKNQKERLEGLAKISPLAWPCNTLGNHDCSRIYNTFGDGEHNEALARLSLALMLTLRGTPFLYNGEEIGMSDLMLADISQFKDLLGVYLSHAMQQAGLTAEQAFQAAIRQTRDKNRTPMQWLNTVNAGFSPQGISTWLPVNPNYTQGFNVNDQQGNPDSLLHFYKRMLAFRQNTPALIAGDYIPVNKAARRYLAFLRQTEGQTCLVTLNYSAKRIKLNVAADAPRLKQLFSSHTRSEAPDNPAELILQPYEIYIAQV